MHNVIFQLNYKINGYPLNIFCNLFRGLTFLVFGLYDKIIFQVVSVTNLFFKLNIFLFDIFINTMY